MHEMSLALNIVELAEQAARDADATRITAIEIDVGEIAGVMLDALEFSLSVATRSTLAEEAKLTLHLIPGSAKCKDCGRTFHISERWAVCPLCGGLSFDILAGKELTIKSIDIE